jgi:hypothetical protein
MKDATCSGDRREHSRHRCVEAGDRLLDPRLASAARLLFLLARGVTLLAAALPFPLEAQLLDQAGLEDLNRARQSSDFATQSDRRRPVTVIGKPEDTEAIVRMLAADGAILDCGDSTTGLPCPAPFRKAMSGWASLIALDADPTQRTNIDDYSTPLDDAEAYGRNEIAGYLRTVPGTKV